jgi:hypothetical protein
MTSPIPWFFALLAFALPGVLFTGFVAARRVTRDRGLLVALAPTIALATWLLAVHGLGLATHSFVRALTLGTLGVAALGPFVRDRRLEPSAGSFDNRPLLLRAAVVVLVTLPVARIAFGWQFHDEDLFTGHMSIPAEIENGIYPPRHLTFAHVELGYHYGFDLLTACVATIFRLPVARAIDVASVGLWMLTAWLVGALGDCLLASRRGWIAILTTLFGGGVPLCLEATRHSVKDPLGFCTIHGEAIASPLVSNFFQHPWALGIPLSLAMWLVFVSARRGAPRLVVLSLLALALSFAHIVLFVTMCASLGFAEVLALWRERQPFVEALRVLASGVFVGAGALVLDGFSRAPPWQGGVPFELRIGVVRGSVAIWHAQSFGLLLPIGLAGLFLLPSRAPVRAVLGGFAVVCLIALNSAHYKYSGDSVKFGGALALALGLGAAVVVDRLARHVRGVIAAAAAIGVMAGGLAFAFVFMVLPSAASTVFRGLNVALTADDDDAASFLRCRVRAGEVVYRRSGPARAYVLLAGLPTAWVDWGVAGFGYPRGWRNARTELLRIAPEATLAWRKEGIVWFVLDLDDTKLNVLAATWIARGDAAVVARFGTLQIVRLSPSDELLERPSGPGTASLPEPVHPACSAP